MGSVPIFLASFLLAACASAPPGKDVSFIPTPDVLVEKMLDMAKLTPRDTLIDLGSGDGRLVVAAAKRGARAMGVEYNAELVNRAKENAAKEGMASLATFVQADLFEVDLSQASVITLFLLDELNLKLRPKLLALRPGTRIVSNTFGMGDWPPDETVTLNVGHGCASQFCTAHLWIVR